jgi:hypothetical protein
MEEEEILVPEDLGLEDVLTEPERVPVVITVKGKAVEKEYWVRPPDDLEKAMAQNGARKVSRELREVLTDPKSEMHQLIVRAGIEEMTADEMRLLWLTSKLIQESYELSRMSLEDRDDFFVPRPEGKNDGVIPPTLEENDQYEIDKRAAEKDRLTSLADQQKAMFARLRKEADKLSMDDLRNVVEPMIIDQKTQEEWANQYGLQVLVRCTFLDPQLTERAFKDDKAARRLLNTNNGKKVLEALLLAHKGLMLDPDQLKN